MPSFFRYVDPSYYGAPVLPATFETVSYSRINVTSGGTGGGGSAFADGAKGSGPNIGTLFVAFGEDATANNVNRGLRALATNTDRIDDLFHRSIAVPTRTADTSSGSPVASIVLPVGTYCPTATTDFRTMFSILDDSDNELLVSGVEVIVTSVTGGAVDSEGFSTTTITINLNNPIPASTTYRVYYGLRYNLATLPADAFTTIKIRGAQEVDAGVEQALSDLIGNGYSWNTTPISDVYSLAYAGLNERMGRSRFRDASNPWLTTCFPVALSIDTVGSGGWFTRDGAPMMGIANTDINGSTAYTLGTEIGAGAIYAAEARDTNVTTLGSINTRAGLSMGFAYFGGYRATTDTNEATDDRGPSIASFYHGIKRETTGAVANARTQITAGSTVNVSADSLTLAGGDFFYTLYSGSKYSSVALEHDLVELRDLAGARHYFVIWDLSSIGVCTLRNLDGSVPVLPAQAWILIRWISSRMQISDGAAVYRHRWSPGGAWFGFSQTFYSATPSTLTPAAAYNAETQPEPFTVYGRYAEYTDTDRNTALKWGGFSQDTVSGKGSYVGLGTLRGDGSVVASYLVTNSKSAISVTSTAVALSIDCGSGRLFVVTPSTTTRSLASVAFTNVAEGHEFTLVFDSSTYALLQSDTSSAFWPSTVRFSSATDRLLAAEVGWLDKYHFVNVGTGVSPVLLCTVTRHSTSA